MQSPSLCAGAYFCGLIFSGLCSAESPASDPTSFTLTPITFPDLPPRSRALQLTPSASLALELTLSNSGEDAYWVQLSLGFPWGLSFRKVEMLKVREKAEPTWFPCESLQLLPSLETQQPGMGSRGMQRSSATFGFAA